MEQALDNVNEHSVGLNNSMNNNNNNYNIYKNFKDNKKKKQKKNIDINNNN